MITIKITKETLNNLITSYKEEIINENIGYILYVIKTEDNYIYTIYDNNKRNYYKMTIQGEDPMSKAIIYSMDEQIKPKKEVINKESPYFIDVDKQIGSDEVGTGDFLAPIVVCACFVDHDTMELINKYNINDSKKLSDEKILKIIPLIINKVHYSSQLIENDRYSDAIKKGFNMNKIKAILHNHCLFELHQKFPYVKNIYVDKFCEESNYFEYLNNTKKVEKDIVFKEKGETYFPSVALASCIARFLFLKNMEYKNKKYSCTIPLGAGENVNTFSKKFIKKYGYEEFLKIAKANFKNFDSLNNLF